MNAAKHVTPWMFNLLWMDITFNGYYVIFMCVYLRHMFFSYKMWLLKIMWKYNMNAS